MGWAAGKKEREPAAIDDGLRYGVLRMDGQLLASPVHAMAKSALDGSQADHRAHNRGSDSACTREEIKRSWERTATAERNHRPSNHSTPQITDHTHSRSCSSLNRRATGTETGTDCAEWCMWAGHQEWWDQGAGAVQLAQHKHPPNIAANPSASVRTASRPVLGPSHPSIWLSLSPSSLWARRPVLHPLSRDATEHPCPGRLGGRMAQQPQEPFFAADPIPSLCWSQWSKVPKWLISHLADKSVRVWNSSVVVSGLGCTQVPSIMVSSTFSLSPKKKKNFWRKSKITKKENKKQNLKWPMIA